MTCPPAGQFFLLAFSFVRFFPAICPPICPPPPPLPLLWCAEVVPSPQREGVFFIFSKGGRCGHRPPFASPRGIFLPGGAMRKFWRGGGSSRSFFPPSPLPPAPSRCCGVPKWCPHRSGRGIFYFFKRGSGHRPPFASPRGTFLPDAAMRKFWRGRTLFFHLPCLGMRKAREQMLPGFCVTPNSRSSSSPSAGSCGRCAPPWGRCPGSTAPGRPCRR